MTKTIISEEVIMVSSAKIKRYRIILAFLMVFTCCGGDSDDENDASTQDATTPDSSSSDISLSESSYDFGGVILNNKTDRTFAVTNNGNASLVIGDAILSSNSSFDISSDECSGQTLSAGDTCSLIAQFSPLVQGELNDTLSIPSNDPDGTAIVGLSGEGYGLNVWINKIETSGCEVTVDVTVTNPMSSDVLDSLEDKITVYENGEDITQDIMVSPISTLIPVSIVLAIDWSVSEIGIIDTIQSAANAFLDNLDSPNDEAAACKFNGLIDIDPEATDSTLFYTGEFSGLKTYINSDYPTYAGTIVYDAVYASIERADQGNNDKKAVIVLSDGVDEATTIGGTGSTHTLAEVIAYAVDLAIPVFTIFYVDPDYADEGYIYGNREVMEHLAVETGGKYYNGTDNLADVYQQISNLLTNNYTITYTSSNCNSAITLDVRAEYNSLYGEDSRDITLP